MQKLFKDNLMVLFVMGLAIIDLFILLQHTVNKAVKDNLGVKPTSSRELPYKNSDWLPCCRWGMPVGQKITLKFTSMTYWHTSSLHNPRSQRFSLVAVPTYTINKIFSELK